MWKDKCYDNTMNKTLEQCLQKLSPDIRQLVQQAWADYQTVLKSTATNMPEHNDFIPSLCRVWASSNFVIKNCIRYPKVILDLFSSGDILLEYVKGEYSKKLKKILSDVQNHHELISTLRKFRRREMLRIAWRDLAKWTQPIKTMNDLSALADTCIGVTNELLQKWQTDKYGTPLNKNTNKPMSLFIVAMGKLGAYELNFSSDVDLIYCYAHDGELESGMTYHTFFLRLAQQLTVALDKVTADGFVFRVDLRLRPYGSSGAIVNSVSAFADYYQEHGRDWERYALVKARIINHTSHASLALLRIIRQFVYRNYLDYSAIESLRKLQLMINQELLKKGLENNIKRGAGGIREIEFISQTHKVIRGGRQFRLQARNTLKSLILLREIGCLTETVARDLMTAYKFLRNVENHLQMLNDQQTHELPTDALSQKRIAYSMRYVNWKNFKLRLDHYQKLVHHYFQTLIAQPRLEFIEQTSRELEQQMQKLWGQSINNADTLILLSQVGYTDAKEVIRLIIELKEYANKQKLSHAAFAHLNRLMPHLLAIIGSNKNSDLVLNRMIPLIEVIIKHSVYLVLLLENPIVLSQAVTLCAISPWIANQLTSYPLLLDELLDPKTLFTPPTVKKLKKLLNQQLNSTPEANIEQQLEAIRWFKQAHVLRVAAADVTGLLPLMRVSDYLTDIATVVLNKVRELVLHELIAEYGKPILHKKYKQSGFCIVAYGKLGGIELGYNSDLDLVFLQPVIDNQALTNGKHPITNEQFYTRLGKRIIQIMNQTHASGFLYKLDLRLRPSGSAGLLVNSVSAFAEYQHTEAWDWEHQALVRARPIAGETDLGREFSQIRIATLQRQRSVKLIRQNVREMREKMRLAKEKHEAGFFDLKQGKGGIIDIEFIAQYAVLRWGHHYPSLLEYPDNVRILERIAMEGLIRIKDISLLSEAYKAYRAYIHQSALQNQTELVAANDFQFFRIGVYRIWEQLFIEKC